MGVPLSADQAWAQWGAMVSAARGVLGCRDEAAECATQAIVQVLERQPCDVANAEAFMVTIAKRRAIDRIRVEVRARRAAERLRAGDEPAAAWINQPSREALIQSA